jgi:uncharacterized protein YecT (DUF1311 family)
MRGTSARLAGGIDILCLGGHDTMMRANLLLSLLLAVGTSQAQTQSDLNRSACAELDAADAELNSVYREIRERYRGDALFLDTLKTAQRAWIAFRDAELAALYPAQAKQIEYGSIYPMCECTTLAGLTRERTAQLRGWLDVEEGDACGGSRRP